MHIEKVGTSEHSSRAGNNLGETVHVIGMYPTFYDYVWDPEPKLSNRDCCVSTLPTCKLSKNKTA